MRVRMIAVAVAGMLAAACTDSQTPTAVGLEEPLASLSDANHTSGNPHFFFLPPMVQHPRPFNGAFDNTLAPVVDICELDLTGACVGPVAHFATARRHDRGNSERVRRDGNHYHVNWHTRRFHLDPAKFYRICVSVGPNALGHADVDVLRHGRGRRNVDRDQFVPLENGSTLPIKFRIEEGALAAVGDAGCAGALRPAEIRGTKCLVTADGDDEDDDDHPDPSPSLTGRGGHDDDDRDGHDRDGRDEHDDDDDDDRDDDHDWGKPHDRDKHDARCERDDDHGAGIADWPISLYQGTSVVLNTVTDAEGDYSFTGLQPGAYTVCEGVRDGFVQVFPKSGASCSNGTFGYDLVLGSGQVAKHKDFGNQGGAPPPPPPTGGIQGRVLLAGEPLGLSDWVITLFDGNGVQLAQTTSEANPVNPDLTGNYAFGNLQAGTYLVCVELPSGVAAEQEVSPVAGDPGTAACVNGTIGYLITITAAGEVITGRDFSIALAG